MCQVRRFRSEQSLVSIPVEKPSIAGIAKQCRTHPANDVASVAASLFCIWPPWSANHPQARIPVQQRQGASFRFSVWSWPGPRRIEPFTETKQFRVHRAYGQLISPEIAGREASLRNKERSA